MLIKSVDWPSLAKAGARSAMAAAVIWAWLRRPQFTWSRTQIGAAVAYALVVTLFVVANDRTTAANAIFLQYTAPIYVAVLGPWLIGERARRLDWLCIALALVGIALTFRDEFSASGLIGNLAGLGSGLAFATMAMLLRKDRHGSPASALLLGNLLTAAIGLPFGFGKMPVPAEWIALVVLGIFQLGISYVLYSVAIRHIRALEAIVITMLEPILNPVWVALRQHEVPGPWSLAGGALVLSAVLLRAVAR